MSTIAIIPARGGSKRLPRKNIMDFFDKPLIGWTIEAAVQSGCFDKVLVSTEDSEIADVARRHGADVPFLRPSAADDITPVSVATQLALAQAESHWQCRFDTVVQLMANCPIRGGAEIQDALAQFQSAGADFQISCFPFGWMNPWWAVELDDQSRPKALFPDALKQRSQDLPKLYCPTGAIWIANARALEREKTFYGPGHRFEPLHWMAAVDIDDAEDLLMAQAVFQVKQQAGGNG